MAGKQMQAIIALAGKIDPSLATAVKQAETMINNLDKKGKRSKAIAAMAGKTAKKVAVGLGAAAAAGGVFIGKSVQKGMEFDSEMSQVAATLGTTTDQIGDLRKFALEMGSTTAFTATQSAEALNYMALAGYDAETSMAMLPNVLNLAAAGNIELGAASDMVTDAQSALGLSIEQTETLVDQMAKTASKTNTSVGQLGEAILTVGGTAQYMAGGTAGVNAALGVLADNGIKASEGGTHLRNILLKLSSPTSEASALLEQMGVQAFDAQGKLKDFSELFPELNAAMSTMTDEQKLSAMSTLFNARDIASATALLGTTKERWDEIGSALQNCEGAAQAMANTQLDNLEGDVTLFKSALEGAQITLADSLNPSLREMVQFGTQAMTQLQGAFSEGGISSVITTVVDIVSQILDALIAALPQIIQAGFQLIVELAAAIISALPQLIQVGMQIILMLIQGLTSSLPQLLTMAVQAVIQMAQGIVSALPQIIQAGLQLIMALAQAIMTNMPVLLAAGVQIVGQIILGIIQALPQIITCAVQLVTMYFSTIISNISSIISAGIQIVFALLQGIASALPQIISAGIQGVFMLAQGLLSNVGAIISAGVQLVIQLGQAIITNLPSIIGQIVTGLGQGILDGVGSFFGGIGDFFGGIFGGGEAAASTSAAEITAPFEMVPMQVESSLGQIGTIASGAATDAESAFAGLGDTLTSSLDMSQFENLGSDITSSFDMSSMMDGMDMDFSSVFDSTLMSAQSTASELGSSFDQTGTQIQQALGSETVSGIQTEWQGLQSFFTEMASQIGSSFTETGTTIQTSMTGQVEQINSQWTGFGETFTATSTQVSAQCTALCTALTSQFRSAWTQITASFMQGATAASSSASIITGSLSGISSMLYGIVSAASSAASALRSMASAATSAGAAASVARAAGAGKFATGGISNGLGIVGEDPRYPHEVVITPNPAYRSANIGYLNAAARMLGVSSLDDTNPGPWGRAIDAMGGSGIVANMDVESRVSVGDINFTPNITIQGNAGKDDIVAALRKVMPEFQEVVMEALQDGGIGDYSYEI